MNTQYNEISRVSVNEGKHLVHYILVLGYTPGYDEPANEDGEVEHNDPDWDVRMYRRVEGDTVDFSSREDRVLAWLNDPEDRVPTAHDINPDAWQSIYDAARSAYGWHSWDNWMTSFRLFGSLLQGANALTANPR